MYSQLGNALSNLKLLQVPSVCLLLLESAAGYIKTTLAGSETGRWFHIQHHQF